MTINMRYRIKQIAFHQRVSKEKKNKKTQNTGIALFKKKLQNKLSVSGSTQKSRGIRCNKTLSIEVEG